MAKSDKQSPLIRQDNGYNKEDLRCGSSVDAPLSDNAQVGGLYDDFVGVLCEDMGYAALYIDRNYLLKEAIGNFKKFLSLPEKNYNLNLLKIVPGDLSVALTTAIGKAIRENKKVVLQKVKIRDEQHIRTIDIWVKPGSTASTNPYTLIVLGEESPEKDNVIALQAELKETKISLRSAIESMQTANEELQSSNKELLLSNEELQSSNEELQSLNEELHSLNTDHQAKIHELLELQKANIDLANSNDELQQFASVASHDLKEPLRKIYMFSNMLKDNHFDANDGAQLYIERIIRSSERMIQLVNDLLSFSRLSVESTFEPVDLNIILNEVLADLELTIQEKKATLEIDELPVVDVLPGQIRQVFQNILSNALKFSRPNVPAYIRITADPVKEKAIESAVDENGGFVRICLQDNGIGFNEKYLPKIFTIFQRLHTRKEYDGTGIGLAICKKIVEKHGGIITARSEENVGSTFIILLPLKHKQGLQPGKTVMGSLPATNR